jgi:transposase-like protein
MNELQIHSIHCPHCCKPSNYKINILMGSIKWTQIFICHFCEKMFQAEVKKGNSDE